MNLELSGTEALELKRALDIYLAEQAFEVARTHERKYRHDLVVDNDALEAIRKRLEQEIATQQAANSQRT
ncbi:MAG: hypothetical protein HY901_08675 [Deltaproteobacteria bacterium]|nr:hypothetical protein [Deltaproteobacteria bacterium]